MSSAVAMFSGAKNTINEADIAEDNPMKMMNFHAVKGVRGVYDVIRLKEENSKLENINKTSKHLKNLTEGDNLTWNQNLPDSLFLIRYELFEPDVCESKIEQTTENGTEDEVHRIKDTHMNASHDTDRKCEQPTLDSIRDFQMHDFTINSANFLLPCWWTSQFVSTSQSHNISDEVSDFKTVPQISVQSTNLTSKSLPLQGRDANLPVKKNKLVAMIVDDTLFAGADPAVEITDMFGQWYYDWFRWRSELNDWNENFYQTHFNDSLDSHFDRLDEIIHAVKHPAPSANLCSNKKLPNCSENDTKISSNSFPFTGTNDDRLTIESIDQLLKSFDRIRPNEFYENNNIPEEIWPGKMDAAGKTFKQKAILAHSYFNRLKAPRPVLATALYEVTEQCIKLQTILSQLHSNSETFGSPDQDFPSNTRQCYTLVDLKDLLRKWLHLFNPARRKSSKFSLLFYIRKDDGDSHNGEPFENSLNKHDAKKQFKKRGNKINNFEIKTRTYSESSIAANDFDGKLDQVLNFSAGSSNPSIGVSPQAINNKSSVNFSRFFSKMKTEKRKEEKSSVRKSKVSSKFSKRQKGKYIVDKSQRKFFDTSLPLLFIIKYKMEGE